MDTVNINGVAHVTRAQLSLELAAIGIKHSVNSIAQFASRGRETGPEFIKVGQQVLYPRNKTIAWFERRAKKTTVAA